MNGVWILTETNATGNTQAFSSLSVLVCKFPHLFKRKQTIYRAVKRRVAYDFEHDGLTYSLRRVPMFRPGDV